MLCTKSVKIDGIRPLVKYIPEPLEIVDRVCVS